MATSSIGSDIVSSMSIGTFNPQTIATALANAEAISQKSTIQDKQAKQKNQLTAYTTIQTALQGLKSGLTNVAASSSFMKNAVTSSDESAVGATISSTATTGTYDIAVAQRATADVKATAAFASQSATVGSGKLLLSVGGSSKSIDVSSGASLSGIKDAINNANAGVAASIVNDGSGYRLLLSGKNTGEANRVTMTLDPAGTNDAGLSSLVSGVTQVGTASQDAMFSVNGLTLTSATNQVTGVLDGVTLNLNKASSSVITVSADTSDVKGAVQSIVDDYNSMKSILDSYTSYAKSDTDETVGILSGDSTVSNLRYQIRNMLNFRSSDSTSKAQSMADIGVKTELDGTLSLDETKLNQMLADDKNGVAALFASMATSNSTSVRFQNATARTVAGTYTFDGVTAATQASYQSGTVSSPNNNFSTSTGNNTFSISVNGTTSNLLTVAPTSSTKNSAMATTLQGLINNDANLQAKGIKLAVTYDSTNNRYDFVTDQYGSAAKITLSGVGSDLSSQLGLANASGTSGTGASGTLVSGSNRYVFTGTGQHVKINSMLTGAPKDLEFDVLGAVTNGNTITVTNGYASGLSTKIDSMLDSSKGLVGTKITNITASGKTLSEQLTKVEAQYDALVTKYTYQFGLVNALQNQMSALSTSLKSMFQNNNSDD